MTSLVSFTSMSSRTGRGILNVLRRQGWIFDGMTPTKARNLALALGSWAGKTSEARGLPSILKIDISPVCNLSCTVCVHADPAGRPDLARQEFKPSHRMSVEQFAGLVEQVRGVACAVSLYYLGDPLAHPDLDRLCRVARDASLNVHWSSNMSFGLTDERIEGILRSGVTHLTACVDGFSQGTYEKTRIGGRFDLVISNLERLCRVKRELGLVYPKIEVQYLCYRHNLGERAAAQEFFDSIGVDQISYSWGDVHNYLDLERQDTLGPIPASTLPKCAWPYFSLVVKYNGDILPCCVHRLGEQYAVGGEPRAIGNVFTSPLRDVWNSEGYALARRMVSDPGGAAELPDTEQHFCHGCARIYETNRTWRSGNEHDLAPSSGAKRRGRRLPLVSGGT